MHQVCGGLSPKLCLFVILFFGIFLFFNKGSQSYGYMKKNMGLNLFSSLFAAHNPIFPKCCIDISSKII